MSRPENKAPKLPPESNSPLAETKCSRQTPPSGGYLLTAGKSPVARECVVEDAVKIGPVSFPKIISEHSGDAGPTERA